jgi:hypothetical protein
MEDQNVAPQADPVAEPVQEPTQEPQEPAQEPVQEEPAQADPEPSQTQEPEVPAEPPVSSQAQEPAYDITQFMQQPQTQPTFTPDEDGYIDPNQFYNQVLQDAETRIEQKIQFQEQERRAWQSVEEKFPEIKEDSELREMVNAQRLADVARGGKGDLNDIAGKVIGKFQSYQSKGKAQAQVSEKVQKSAGLQQNTATNVDTTKDQDLMERMSRGDEAAKEELISSWLESGKI